MMLKHELDRLKAAIEALDHTLAHLDEVHSQVVRLHRTFSVLFYVVVASLIVGNLIAWCGGKSAPISTPIATPTAITLEKGVIGPEPGPQEAILRLSNHEPEVGPSSNNRLQGITVSESPVWGLVESRSDIPWRGLVVLPDLSVVYLDSEMAATMWSVMECESRFNPRAVGKAGERGLFQIHPIHQKRIAAMGFTWDQMLEIEPNVAVAESIWQERGWSAWSCQPTYQADGHD